jgi:gamma-glutamyltranspeptidase/glutathione hydrolase
MVSLIQSNYRGMGSGMTWCPAGLHLPGPRRDVHAPPGHANDYAPGKRPFHTIIPAFITKDGAPWLSFGVMGGAMQPQGHVQIVCQPDRLRHERAGGRRRRALAARGLLRLRQPEDDRRRLRLSRERRALRERARAERCSGAASATAIARDSAASAATRLIHCDAKNRVYVGASEILNRKDGQALRCARPPRGALP